MTSTDPKRQTAISSQRTAPAVPVACAQRRAALLSRFRWNVWHETKVRSHSNPLHLTHSSSPQDRDLSLSGAGSSTANTTVNERRESAGALKLYRKCCRDSREARAEVISGSLLLVITAPVSIGTSLAGGAVSTSLGAGSLSGAGSADGLLEGGGDDLCEWNRERELGSARGGKLQGRGNAPRREGGGTRGGSQCPRG